MHLGSEIHRELKRQGQSVVWLASQLACSRTNVYKIFLKENIDTGLLRRISCILHTDFFKLLSNDLELK